MKRELRISLIAAITRGSMATSAAVDQLASVLRVLLSPDNAARAEAEAFYNSLVKDAPVEAACGLLEVVAQRAAHDQPIRYVGSWRSCLARPIVHGSPRVARFDRTQNKCRTQAIGILRAAMTGPWRPSWPGASSI
jgi:hypothetical protein